MKPLEKNDGFNFINYILPHLCNCLKKRDIALGGFIDTSWWWYIYKVNLKISLLENPPHAQPTAKTNVEGETLRFLFYLRKENFSSLCSPAEGAERKAARRRAVKQSLGRKRSSRRCLHAVLILLRNRVRFSIAAVKQHHFHPPHAKFPKEPSITHKSSVLFKD